MLGSTLGYWADFGAAGTGLGLQASMLRYWGRRWGSGAGFGGSGSDFGVWRQSGETFGWGGDFSGLRRAGDGIWGEGGRGDGLTMGVCGVFGGCRRWWRPAAAASSAWRRSGSGTAAPSSPSSASCAPCATPLRFGAGGLWGSLMGLGFVLRLDWGWISRVSGVVSLWVWELCSFRSRGIRGPLWDGFWDP